MRSDIRRFLLDRRADVTGLSGTGIVAEGVQFTDGLTVLRWLSETPSTIFYDSLEAMFRVHGHDGKTVIRWLP